MVNIEEMDLEKTKSEYLGVFLNNQLVSLLTAKDASDSLYM